MAENSKPSKPIMDVAHPGKTAPPTNSKSVIITHRPVVQDPMMIENKLEADAPSDKQAAAPSHSKVIQPLTAPLVSSDKAASEPDNSGPTDEAKPQEDKPNQPDTEKTKEAVATDTEATTADQSKTAAEDDGDAGPISPQAAIDAEAAAKQKADEALQLLVESKQYLLPINTAEKRRTKRTLVIGIVFSIILIAAWLDVALDAGMVHLGNVQPLTHFFSS